MAPWHYDARKSAWGYCVCESCEEWRPGGACDWDAALRDRELSRERGSETESVSRVNYVDCGDSKSHETGECRSDA